MARRRGKKSGGRLRSLASGVAAGTRRGLRFGLQALPLVLILGSAGWGATVLWKTAMADPHFRIGGDTLRLTGAAGSCKEARRAVHALGQKAAGRSLLDPWLLEDLRRAYEESPWVKRVCSLQRVFPDRLAVQFILRVPAAQVRARGWYWLVDRDGVLLSVPGRQEPHAGVPEIVGTLPRTLSKPPAYGAIWQDDAVADGLDVLRTLAHSPLSEDLRVRRVLVHRGSFLDTLACRRRKRPRLDIETEEGVLIRWGTVNAERLPGRLQNAEKVSMLRNLLRREIAVPGICLDVRTRVPGYAIGRE